MAETRKARARRLRDGWFEKFCPADQPGLDIGCSDDPVHPTFRQWDMALGHGDAAHLAGIPAGTFASVFASHVLEHMPDPLVAVREWYRVTAPGGHLTVVVPAMAVYEVGDDLPSRWNADHKTFWRPDARRPDDGPHVRGLKETLAEALPDAELVWFRDADAEPRATADRHASLEYSIEATVRKPWGSAEVLIVSMASAAFDPEGIAEANHARFAALAGHRHRFHRTGFDPHRPPAWSKVLFLRAAVEDSPWVFWIDADAVFLRPADLRQFLDPAYEMVIGCDPAGVNTGAFFLRAGPWAERFLARVWELGADWKFRHHAWWEQAAVSHLLDTDPDVARRVKLVDYRLFNGHPHLDGEAATDLVAHFPGMLHADKLAQVRTWAARLGGVPKVGAGV